MQSVELQLQLGERTILLRFAEAGIEWLASEILRVLGDIRPRLMLVSDEHVALHYEDELADSLRARGFAVATHVFPCGEEHKTLRRIEELSDHLAEENFARDDVLVALGGGVVTDAAGFAAAIYKRGLNWIACPTSLMGMADAAIGGKTGVDHPLGKNLLGAFYQPRAIFAATSLLDTLDEREWRSGSAEVTKTALLANGIWNELTAYGPNLFEWPKERILGGILHAARTKIDIVAQDERDSGARRLLNLGHTFGHALETATNYQTFTHGEAVFCGLRGAVRLSQECSFLNSNEAAAMDEVLARMPVPRVALDAEKTLSALPQDKKASGGKQHWVLLKKRGEAFITADVDPQIVRDVAQWLCETVASGAEAERKRRRCRLLVINGPNLNLLGEREPEVYGNATHDDLAMRLKTFGEREHAEIIVRQSNLEGEMVTWIQRARYWADGIIVNAGGYTHTSVAIRDAVQAVKVPTAEVHISDILQREDFRKVSLLRDVCAVHCYGQGLAGYERAAQELLKLLRAQDPCAAA